MRAGLKCKASKCSQFTQTINYLGRVVSTDGITPTLPSSIKSEWPKPEKGTGLASFLGLSNYYNDLILFFAHISDTLYKVYRAYEIHWTEAFEFKFEELKQQLLQLRIVRLPDPDRPFIFETDGSRVAVEAVLKQRFEDTGLEHPVGFFSRTITGSERNYAAYEVELYAVVRGVEHFRIFLLGREFLLQTDHGALRNLLRRDLPPTTRVERWIIRLSEYNFKIEYQRGQYNVIASVLLRLLFAGANNVEKSIPLDKEPRGVNSLKSEAPRPSLLKDSFSELLISDATSVCDKSDESLSDSDNSSS